MSEEPVRIPDQVTAPGEPLPATPQEPRITGEITILYERMLKQVRSWGITLLFWAVLSLVMSGTLSAPWGILLLLVGGASFFVREASMFAVYAVTLVWAALRNVTGGSLLWLAFGGLQVYLAYTVFRDFVRYRQVEADYLAYRAQTAPQEPPPPQRAARVFPVAALALGILALLGEVGSWLGLDAAVLGTAAATSLRPWLFELRWNLALLGLSLGLASFLSKHRAKLLAAIGMVLSTLGLVDWVLLMVLVALGQPGA